MSCHPSDNFYRLTVEPLTPALREQGGVRRGTPARFAVVQRNRSGGFLAVLFTAIEQAEAVTNARTLSELGDGRFVAAAEVGS